MPVARKVGLQTASGRLMARAWCLINGSFRQAVEEWKRRQPGAVKAPAVVLVSKRLLESDASRSSLASSVPSGGRVAVGVTPHGSHRSGRARQRGIRFVASLRRCPSHDRAELREHASEAQCPRRGSNRTSTTRPPFAPQGPRGPVPPLRHYYGALRLPDHLLAALRFLRLTIPWSARNFVPARPQTQSRRIIPEFAVPVAPDPVFFKERPGSPKFPENPLIIRHVPPTPV